MKSVEKKPDGSIDIFENDLERIIPEYLQKVNAETVQDLTQQQWNGLMIFANKHVFSHYNLRAPVVADDIHSIPTNSNAWNTVLIEKILDEIYIPACMEASKEISINGFAFLIGCHHDIIRNWGTNRDSVGSRIHKKLVSFREETLSNSLLSSKRNPVGIMAILNHHYSWNMPGVTVEKPKTDTIEQIAQRHGLRLEDKESNATPITLPDADF